MDWLDQNAWAAWLALALALGAVEAATADFVFIMLAGGALAGAATAAVTTSFPMQVVAAVVTAVLLLGLVRPGLKRRLLGRGSGAAIGAGRYIGRAGVVTSQVTSDGGRIRIDGEDWSARCAPGTLPLGEGARVTVVSIDGATAVVTTGSPTDRAVLGE